MPRAHTRWGGGARPQRGMHLSSSHRQSVPNTLFNSSGTWGVAGMAVSPHCWDPSLTCHPRG